MITLRVISDNVWKSVILTSFNIFYLSENIFNDMVVNFF